MTAYLVFQLRGVLSAFGDLAVGRRRPCLPHPTKSGTLGMIGAALGVDWEDVEGLAALHGGYGFATRVDRGGELLSDFQTADTGGEHPVLSLRDYRSDTLARVALWALPAAPFPLPTLAAALDRPRYPLFLGRRSCPLLLPPAPQLLEAESPTAALRAATFPGADLAGRLRLDPVRSYRWEGPAGPDLGLQAQVSRRDRLLHGVRRQYGERLESVGSERRGGGPR